MDALNLNSLVIDENGRVSFSGLTSEIDFQEVTDSIIAAKRIPIDTIEARIESNTEKVAALKDLRSLLNSLSTSVNKLRGAVSVDSANNIFASKVAFATSSRTDSQTPAAAGNLMGVSVANSADLGSHTVEILRVATAHKVMSDAQTSTTTALGITGTFTVNGTSITMTSSDTLQDVRDRINNANTGTGATEVSASIVSISATENHLVLTADKTGTNITLADTSGTPLDTLGVLTGASIKNELQSAQTARLKADGFTDPDRHETNLISSDTAALNTLFTAAASDGSFVVNGNTVNYLTTDTLQTLATKIAASDGAGGVESQVIQDGSKYRLEITHASGTALTFTDTDGLLAEMGLNNEQIFERSSNTINDLFTGVTLSLFQAEEDTTIKIDVERDLTSVVGEVDTFVESYNAVRVFLNQQSLIDTESGEAAEDAGVLFGNNAIRTVQQQLSTIVGQGTLGVNDAFSVLAQIGVDLVDNAALVDPLNRDTLEVNNSKLEEALLNNPDDVRRLFAFDFSSSDPRVALLDYTSETTFNASGYTLNVNFDDKFDSAKVTNNYTFTQTDAETNGPLNDGISLITFDQTVATGNAYRYSYDSVTETLTLNDLTNGTNQAIDITAILDAAAVTNGPGGELAAGETADVDFSSLGVTFRLTGDAPAFSRATDITGGATNTAGLGPGNGGSFTNLNTVLPSTGLSETAIDALVAAGAYSQATGLLSLGIESSGAGVSSFSTAAGIKFTIDGAGVPAADITATDLDDASSHTIEIFVDDGGNDVQVAQLTFDALSGSTGAGSGTFTVDLGTGLFGETAALTTGKDAPMNNYYTIANGSFEIRDESNSLLGTVNFNATDSLEDLATNITNNVTGVSAAVIENVIDNSFRIQIVSDDHDPLNFVEVSGGLVAELNLSNVGDSVFSANIGGPVDGTDNGSVTVSSGRTLTATSLTEADGLKVIFDGSTDLSGITLDFTVGVGAQFFGVIDELVDPTSGTLEAEIDTLEDQNEVSEDRVEQMLVRLELERQRLLDKFIAMEQALSSLANIRQSITELTAALTSDN
ncbi:MAG: flagellar filament capping protein FliD [Alphaproteobacteria bacterium]|nr:flagellar filament capping protein FliD [Alphaproteobacteria bacterium]